jgi:genome maintenance exonuclease 1
MINHIPINYPVLTQINLPDKRLYEVPGGNQYPSITTVLSESAEKGWLEDWRNRVGDEEADRVSTRARLRGTALHGYCEDYLNNKKFEVSMFDLQQFKQFKMALKNVDNVYGIEKALFSHRFQTAGTTDLAAEYYRVPSIIDWKTSKTEKKREDIPDYFIQGAFYAVSMYEMFRIKIENIVIVMAVDGADEPLVFQEKVRDWVPYFVEKRKIFKEKRGF